MRKNVITLWLTVCFIAHNKRTFDIMPLLDKKEVGKLLRTQEKDGLEITAIPYKPVHASVG